MCYFVVTPNNGPCAVCGRPLGDPIHCRLPVLTLTQRLEACRKLLGKLVQELEVLRCD